MGADGGDCAMSRYALYGDYSKDLLTFQGLVIVHDNKSEMEWLLPNSKVVRITDGDLGRPVMKLKDHPGVSHISFPLKRSEFR